MLCISKTVLILFVFLGAVSSLKEEVLFVPKDATNLSMVVREGETFKVQMKGNPTTGYMWILEKPQLLNKNIVSPLNLQEENSGEYTPDAHERGMVGFGGVYEFTFKAGKSTGELVNLNFAYKRTWESENGRTVQVKVHVTK